MCSMYWNLDIKIKCSKCERTSKWNLQTHFMGEDGSCMNHYSLNQEIPELKRMTGELNRNNDWFIGDCPICGNWLDFGAKIVNGKIKKVWILTDKGK